MEFTAILINIRVKNDKVQENKTEPKLKGNIGGDKGKWKAATPGTLCTNYTGSDNLLYRRNTQL